MPCVPGGRSCNLRSSPTPVPLSDIVTEPTLLPWASFISTTVLAALASDQKMIVDDTAAMKNRLCFIGTDYNQGGVGAPFMAFRAAGSGFACSQLLHNLLQLAGNPFWVASGFESNRGADLHFYLAGPG